MISGAHSIVFGRDPGADRAFCRDVLKLLTRVSLPGGSRLGVCEPRRPQTGPA